MTRLKFAESEAKYRKLFEEINSLIIGFDLNGAISFFNHFSENLFGYSRDEVIGKPFVGTIIPVFDSTGNDNSDLCRKILKDPRAFYANESEGVCKNGRRVVFSWSAKAVRLPSGTITEILIDGNDITERKIAEQASRESERNMTEAQRISHVGSWLWNMETDEITCSAETFRIYGEEPFSIDVTPDIFLGYVHPHDRESLRSLLADIREGRTGSLNIEFRIVRKNGMVRYIHSIGEVNGLTDEGKARSIRGTGQDVTERKLLEKELKDERDFVTAVIQTSGALITVIDMNGMITRFNKASEELTGYTEDEVMGKSVFDLFIPQEEHDEVAAVAARLFAGERRVDFENHWITKSGEKRFIRWRNTILLDYSSTPVGAVATGIDITGRKSIEDALHRRTEELEIANRDLEAFSYSVSHDLRSPLAIIQGFTDMMQEEYGHEIEENGRNILGHIKSATEKMSSIINDLLSLARVSREAMNCQQLDLSPIADSILNELRHTQPQRTVMARIDDSMPAFADPGLMTIAFTNLIGNAWKYSGKNPDAQIEIGMTAKVGENAFFIRDNGAGFDMKFAHKLFKPFERLHSDVEFEGTGIGLAIVHRIIHRHGGRIWAESQTNRGSAFYFTLNCRQKF